MPLAPCFAYAAGLKRAHNLFAQGNPLVDLAQYLPILIFLGIALLLSGTFVFLPMLVGRLTGAHQPDPAKLSEYECGFPAFEEPRSQFDVRFYLVAILFIIFDLEAAFLFPWAVSLDQIGWAGWATSSTLCLTVLTRPERPLRRRCNLCSPSWATMLPSSSTGGATNGSTCMRTVTLTNSSLSATAPFGSRATLMFCT